MTNRTSCFQIMTQKSGRPCLVKGLLKIALLAIPAFEIIHLFICSDDEEEEILDLKNLIEPACNLFMYTFFGDEVEKVKRALIDPDLETVEIPIIEGHVYTAGLLTSESINVSTYTSLKAQTIEQKCFLLKHLRIKTIKNPISNIPASYLFVTNGCNFSEDHNTYVFLALSGQNSFLKVKVIVINDLAEPSMPENLQYITYTRKELNLFKRLTKDDDDVWKSTTQIYDYILTDRRQTRNQNYRFHHLVSCSSIQTIIKSSDLSVAILDVLKQSMSLASQESSLIYIKALALSHPNILLYGPKNTNRAYDPVSEPDYELIRHQSLKYKEAFARMLKHNNIENYVELIKNQIEPVGWCKKRYENNLTSFYFACRKQEESVEVDEVSN